MLFFKSVLSALIASLTLNIGNGEHLPPNRRGGGASDHSDHCK